MWMGYSGGIFSNAPGTNVAASGTPTIAGFFGSFPVYKSGITPVSFRAQNTSSANGGGTAISNLVLSTGTTLTAGDYGDITLSGAILFTLTGNTSYTGTLTIGSGTTNATRVGLSTFSMFAGGRGIGGTAGQLSVNGSSGAPFTAGTGGTFAFLGGGLISGANVAANPMFPASSLVTIAGPVDFGNVGLSTALSSIAGTLQINSGGSVNTNPPTYNSGSTLVYNTGGSYTAGAEWTTNSTTAKGVPQAVTIQNNTALSFGTAAAYRQANALLTIASGSSLSLSSVAGGDLRIAAGLTNNNTGTGVGIATGGRAVFVQGTGTYTKSGTDNLDFLIFGAANTLTLATGTNLSLTNTSSTGCLQFNAAGTLALAGTNTVTIVNGGTVGGSSAGAFTGSSPTTSILSLAGTCTWNPGGVVTVPVTVGLQLNGGLTVSTAGRLSAGYVQINQGGFMGGTNPVVYPANGTLIYNHSSGTYGVQALEWPATSGPTNVTVNNNGTSTGISFANNNITARTLTGTLTINQDVDLSGTGPAALTTLNTIANATATIKGNGAFTHSASGSFTTANPSGVNGTVTTSGTITLPTTTSFTFNGTASQVTGTLLPATIAALTINNTAGGTNGVTISNNALTISGVTTLTAGALILPTGAGNLVTFTGNISTPTGGGTLRGSATSNIATNGTIAGTANALTFTTGFATLNNWTHNTTTFGSTAGGLNSVVTINGTFSLQTTGVPDFYVGSAGGLVIASGATYTDNGANNDRILQTTATGGSFTLQSGANFFTGNSSGLTAAGTGAIQTTNRIYSGGANYTFNNGNATAQAIGDALDATGGTGKTGVITGNVVIANNSATGVTLNAGTTITINSPGNFNVGVLATSSSVLTAPATSIINGTGNVNMFGNGATNGSTLVTAHANGVNGTFQCTGTYALNNAGNNNTNFTFNGSVAQTTGSLMPATVNNLAISNTLASATPTADVNLSSSVTVNGTFTNSGRLGVGANTLTLNGVTTFTANKLVTTSSSNLVIGGTGAITGASPFVTGGISLNNFTMNRTGQTFTSNTAMTVGGAYALTNGIHALGGGLTLNGTIAFGSGTLTGGSNPLSIGGSGTVTGNLTATTAPLALTSITLNRSGAIVNLGSNVTVSNAAGVTLTAGNINLGSFNLTNTNSAGNLGTGSASSMIIATGSGQAILTIPTGASTQVFPIGDGTNYSPAQLVFTANSVSGTIGGRVTTTSHPQLNLTGNPQANYLNRYWSFTTSSLTNYTYTATFTYPSTDVTGSASSMKLNRYNGTVWNEDATSTATTTSCVSTTGITQTSFALNGADFTCRKEPAPVTYTWVGGAGGAPNDWATAANWSPSGVPSPIDQVIIDNTSSIPCTITSGTNIVAQFTQSANTFNLNGGTLTVTGAVAYTGGTGTCACGTTVTLSSSSAITVPAWQYGNLNITGGNRTFVSGATTSICNTLTPGAGTITTTGSTFNFNGIGAQTIPALSYTNLTISNARSGAALTLASGTINVSNAFDVSTLSGNTWVNTGNTFVYNGSGTTNQTVAPINYNILTINNTGSGNITMSSTGTIGIASTFNLTAPAYTNAATTRYITTGSTIDYNGTGAQTIQAFKYNNLSISGARASTPAITLASTGIIDINGNFVVSATGAYTVTVGTSTVNFSSASSQPIPAFFYYDITDWQPNSTTVNAGGPRVWANSGIIDIKDGFAPSTGTNTIDGSTIRYSSTGGFTWTMTTINTNYAGVSYNNLTFSGTDTWQLGAGVTLGTLGDVTLSAAGVLYICNNTTPNTLNVGGNYIQSAGSLYVSNSTTLGAGGAGNMNVTGNLTLSGTAYLYNTYNNGTGTITVGGNFAQQGSSFVYNGYGYNGTSGVINVTGMYTMSSSNSLFNATYNITNYSTSGTLNVGAFTQSSGFTYVSYSAGAGSSMTVANDLTLSGAAEFHVIASSASPTTTATVNGNINTSGTSTIKLNSGGSGTPGILVCKGNFTTTSTAVSTNGIINFGSSTISTNQIQIWGNFSKSGTGVFYTSSSSAATGIVFTGNRTHTFSYSGTTSQYTQYVVAAADTLVMSTGLTLGTSTVPRSTFTVNGVLDLGANVITAGNATDPYFIATSGATIRTSNASGLTAGFSGFGTTTTIFSISNGVSYEFYGASAQTTNFFNAPAVNTMNNIIINHTANNVKIDKNINVNGNVIFRSGNVGNLDLNGSLNISLGGSSSISGEGLVTSTIINSGSPTAGNGFIGGIFSLGANPGNVANLGANISASTSLGTTIIERFPGKAITTINTTNNSIRRIYQIQPSTAATGATVSFSYYDAELNSNTESSPNMIVYGSTAANETVNSYNFLGASAFDATANTVTYNNIGLPSTGAGSFFTLANADKYCTAQAGDWNTGSTWTGGAVPPANANICIQHAVTVAAASTASYKSITINTGSPGLNISNGFSVNLAAAGTFTNSSGAAFTVLGGGTTNGDIKFNGNGTVNGANATTFTNLTTLGTLTLTTIPTINGILKINTGASVSATPNYGSSSMLFYNAGGSYNVGVEWGTAGSGIPNNVTYSGTAITGTLNMPTSARTCRGTMLIQNGSLVLSTTTGADLTVGGDWIRVPGVAGFTPNNRAVIFNGSTDQSVAVATGGTETFHYLINNKSGGNLVLNSGSILGFSSPTNVAVTAPNGGDGLQLLSSSNIDLNGQTLSLSGSTACNLLDNGTGNIIGASGSVLSISGATKTVRTDIASTISFGSNVTVVLNSGMNFGSSLSTINGTLRIALGGFVSTNPPIYSNTSTLQYFSGTTYGRGSEWNATSGAGYPNNVDIQLNGTVTTLDLNNSGLGSANPRIAGNLTIGNGGALTMGALGTPLTVLGNVTVGAGTGGSLVLGTTTGGDLNINGDFTVNSGATLTDNGRQVSMQGTASLQTITGVSALSYLNVNNANTVRLATSNPMTIGNRLMLSNGTFDLNGNTLTMANNAELRRVIAAATMSASPVVSGSNTYDLRYDASMTSASEFSSSATAVRDLSVYSGSTLQLNASRTINRNLNLFSGAGININGQTFTLFGNNSTAVVGTIYADGTSVISNSSGITSGAFRITANQSGANPGYFTRSVSNNAGVGSVRFNSDVTVNISDGKFDGGLSGGSTLTTVQGVLEVGPGGSVFPNPVIYSSSPASILRFYNGYDYQVNSTDKTWAAGAITSGNAGIPVNVEVVGSTTDLIINDPRSLRGNLTITDGSFTINTSKGPFPIAGNWSRSGSTSAFRPNNNKVVFNGTTAQTIACSANNNTETFYQQEINNSAGVSLSSTNDSVTNQFILTSGNLTTGSSNEVYITSNSASAVSGGTTSSYVNGRMRRDVTANTSYDFPVGTSDYQKINITFDPSMAGTSSLLAYFNTSWSGTTVDSSYCVINGSRINSALDGGYWTVTPDAQPTAGTYTVTLNERGYSNAPSLASMMGVVKRSNSSDQWRGCGKRNGVDQNLGVHDNSNSAISAGTATVVRSGVASFSDFGIGIGVQPATPLPVKMLYFTAERQENIAVLRWATATEINNDHFDVERSTDGVRFTKIDEVKGQGNSSTTVTYRDNDEQLLSLGAKVVYYRLKQVDIDGQYEYSNIAAINLEVGEDGFHIEKVFNNPFRNEVTITFFTPANDEIGFALYDIRGAQVLEQKQQAVAGFNAMNFSHLEDLAAGIYLLKITHGLEVYSLRLQKSE
ncbi:MAG: T9SS type A sorting domain-containing protein [Chitinophagales bacterium]